MPISTAHRKQLLVRVMTASKKYTASIQVTSSAKSRSSDESITVDADLIANRLYICSTSKTRQPWIPQLGLYSEDKDILLTSNEWLNDQIIDAAQKLL